MQSNLTFEFGPLEKAVFLDRPNRFLVRCRLNKSAEVVLAHLADPGRLKELLVAGSILHLRAASDPRRKTQWSVVLVEAPESGVLVSLQSTLVNELTALALQAEALTELAAWDLVRREYTWAGSRWDFLLENDGDQRLILEVKSVSLVEQGAAMFPDAVTERGRRHLSKLGALQQEGQFETAVLFVVQRSDAILFRPADHIDPGFGQALRQARQQGVGVLVRDTIVTRAGISWGKPLSADFS